MFEFERLMLLSGVFWSFEGRNEIDDFINSKIWNLSCESCRFRFSVFLRI